MKAIVDCNSFYCSCERVFRPDLKNKPVVVLSNNDGCIISRSDEAKLLGVEMTGPYFKAKNLIEQHNVATFSSNYNLYGDMSRRVMDTLKILVGENNVEVYSVDESFLDVSMIEENSLDSYALQMREIVEQWTGVSVSVGIAPTKTLAKIANHLAKKNKAATKCVATIIKEDNIREILKKTSVSGIWGVGRAYADKLINWGITTAWDLCNMPEEWIYKHLGGVVGARLVKELKGIPCIEMKDELKVKKMIATTRMFGKNVTDLNDIKEAIATYTARAGEKLRRQKCVASVLSVFIVAKEESHSANFSRGATLSTHTILPAATSVTNELIAPAMRLAEQIFKPGGEYKKAGVMLSGIVPDTSVQSNLFEPITENNKRILMDALDNLNFSMRDDIVKFASSGLTRDWKMRKEFRSPRYTSRWNELREVV
ncbi:Y-family DNA polymerase [Ginsengibacter hankyongi]|uniref:Y-family DNA polymerase n=1 Tax=Ginsengibacter hankyongi TaxID=2607284 RepID=A0A5J5IIQ2_9BACT|nr:Y-family DNA polymerase [Ginsengibacter hankyongi]KAA9039458.1 Y-family DNA polymerase [Ginsengibacter hankyongi]